MKSKDIVYNCEEGGKKGKERYLHPANIVRIVFSSIFVSFTVALSCIRLINLLQPNYN